MAITRLVDLTQERRREQAAARDRRRGDLDETCRVAYMALVAGTTSRYELVATVGNALAHHGLLDVPFSEVAAHLVAVANGDNGDSARWLQEQIDQLTAMLEAIDRGLVQP